MSGGMTEEQRRRAEANRAAAPVRRAAALAAQAAPPSPRTPVVPDVRCRRLNFKPPRPDGRFVLLWVQSAQRAKHNEALEFAAQRANERGVPLLAVFAGTGDFPHANESHLAFMYEGLCQLRETLETERGVRLLAFCGDPGEVILAASARATEVVVDAGYVRVVRKWRQRVATGADCRVTEVESEVVIPAFAPGGSAGRPEPAAATFRPKVLARLPALTEAELVPTPLDPAHRVVDCDAALALLRGGRESSGEGSSSEVGVDVPDGDATPRMPFPELPLEAGVDACLDALDAAYDGRGVDRSVRRCGGYHVGGEAEAHRKLERFLATRLTAYAGKRNDMGLGLQSHLSPHVHYGQISVVYITHTVRKMATERPEVRRGVDKYVDELVVRRELAVNFALNNPKYDRYEGLPGWARRTLAEHSGDARAYVYTAAQFEAGATHDALWNAGQRELVVSGKQHNYMRMYWAKKILEWSESPEEGWEIAIHLNNKYSLDGRDVASYTGVGWCWGLHDREFPEAAVTGTIRRMSESGMRSKYNDGVNAYLRVWGDETGGPRRAGKRSAAREAARASAGGVGAPQSAPRQMRLKEMFFKRPKT